VTEIEEGDMVVDQDDDEPRNAALVLSRTEIAASRVEINELDQTVADANPTYPSDASIAHITFLDDLREAIPDYETRSLWNLHTTLQRTDVQTYTYPVPRLELVRRSVKDARTTANTPEEAK